jgi:hypothetical protein
MHRTSPPGRDEPCCRVLTEVAATTIGEHDVLERSV